MCGIVGYTGSEQAASVLFDGLEKLEYRGYDSSGIAVIDKKINVVKTKGRISCLKNCVNRTQSVGTTGIGHTRWATHGVPADKNAHPMLSFDGKFAIVHNGIIENFEIIKKQLTDKGIVFSSDTDTEAIVHLLAVEYEKSKNILSSIVATVKVLKGSFALGIICEDASERIFAVKKDSPLIIGLGNDCNMIASDIPALGKRTNRFILPNDFDVIELSPNNVSIYDLTLKKLSPEIIFVSDGICETNKNGFKHFMLKEIYEQPEAVRNLTNNDEVYDDIRNFIKSEFSALPTKIDVIGCGSAYHAALTGKYVIEKTARIPVEVHLAGEYRYKQPITGKNTLSVIISQSGETADSLAALREAKSLNSPVLSIVNSKYSSIARESDAVIYTAAGPEIAVATTKGYTTQLAALFMLCAVITEFQDKTTSIEITAKIKNLDKSVNQALNSVKQARLTAKRLKNQSSVFFIGRGTDFAPAYEGALKLKEISYIHAEAYAASELKHGTISLIGDGTHVIALSTDAEIENKLLSNIKEVKARGAYVTVITDSNNREFELSCDEIIKLPKSDSLFSPVIIAPVLQLISYYTALELGSDIDKPRNLAKSVTVE